MLLQPEHRPALAWQHATELINQPHKVEQIERVESFLETTEPILLQQADLQIDSSAFSNDEKLELLVLYDRVRFLTESNHPEESIRSAELLLEKIPGSLPVLNRVKQGDQCNNGQCGKSHDFY